MPVHRDAYLNALATLISAHAVATGSTAIDGVLIAKSDRPEQPVFSMTGTSLGLVVRGTRRLTLGAHVYELSAGQYIVVPADLPVTGEFVGAGPQEPALCFRLELRPAMVADVLLRSGIGAAPHSESAIAVHTASSDLLDAVVRLLRLLDRPGDIRMLAPLVITEILWRLVTGSSAATVRQIGLADSAVGQVARAVRWIQDNYRQSFRVHDLAELSRMSVSAFYRHFQAVTGVSPIQYQKQIRLQNARMLLTTNTANVTGVGRQVGYDSLSQFSREYRRHFGVPPTKDAARQRETPAES